MRDFLYEYFYFTRAERNASITLSFLCVFFFFLPKLYPLFRAPESVADHKVFQNAIAAAVEQMSVPGAATKVEQFNFRGERSGALPAEHFHFDPNTAGMADFVRLGLPERTAQSILNYREKGGHFYKKEDFGKIYSLRPADYERLLPWVEIAETGGRFPERGTTLPAEHFHFDPNTAGMADFVRLGLPERTAQSILNYREKGGHFYKKEDFGKIYSLRPADYERLLPWVEIAETGGRFPERGTTLPAEHFHFDPNTAGMADFVRLGLPERTAQSILNYREKGGHFYKKEDFKKIYSLQPADFERLEPWIEIAEPVAGTDDSTKRPPFENKKWELKPIDINTAPAEEWEQFRGVGPGFSRRIVNFRDKLGGFVSAGQVGETYGLADSTFQAMKPYLLHSSGVFRKTPVNSATLEELKMHPYLSNAQATILFNYRAQHGRFADLENLKKIKAGFKAEDWERLAAYLSFD